MAHAIFAWQRTNEKRRTEIRWFFILRMLLMVQNWSYVPSNYFNTQFISIHSITLIRFMLVNACILDNDSQHYIQLNVEKLGKYRMKFLIDSLWNTSSDPYWKKLIWFWVAVGRPNFFSVFWDLRSVVYFGLALTQLSLLRHFREYFEWKNSGILMLGHVRVFSPKWPKTSKKP